MDLKHIVEAMVFAAPTPVSTAEIVKAVNRGIDDCDDPAIEQELGVVSQDDVIDALETIERDCDEQQRPTTLQESPSGWRFVTREGYAHWVRALLPELKPEKLSQPALETLALIAYRQPITKADIEAVRGVNCDGMVNKLLERDLVESGGRADLPGRPMLYQTTQLFLDHFGVNNIDNLPNASELRTVELPTAETDEVIEEELETEESEEAEPELTDIQKAEAALEAEEAAKEDDTE